MKPLISVIVPVYNVQNYVRRCLDSLVGQSYDRIEILVVDDGSTDGSGKICNEYAEMDGRVRVFHKNNGGLSSARNYGIKKARGEYICLVDSDDYVKKDFIKELLAVAIDAGAEIVVCGFNNKKLRERVLSGNDATIKLLTEQENIDIVAWNKIYKTDLFVDNDILYPEDSNYEDSLTTYKILSKAKKVAFINNSLYVYEEERVGSITSEAKIEKSLRARERAAKESIAYLSHDDNLKQAAEISLLLAKLAYIDAAIKKKIDNKYLKPNEDWIKENFRTYFGNAYFNIKLKFYVSMIRRCDGVLYSIFRSLV